MIYAIFSSLSIFSHLQFPHFSCQIWRTEQQSNHLSDSFTIDKVGDHKLFHLTTISGKSLILDWLVDWWIDWLIDWLGANYRAILRAKQLLMVTYLNFYWTLTISRLLKFYMFYDFLDSRFRSIKSLFNLNLLSLLVHLPRSLPLLICQSNLIRL